MRFEDTSIYPVITPDFCAGRPVLEVLQAVLRGGARIVQLRDKKDPERYAAEFRRLTEDFGALFIVNDSVDLALKYKADGVHLGQSDIPLLQARNKSSDLIIGISITNLSEAVEAEKNGASYVTLGPIFPTISKPDAQPAQGIEKIKTIAPHLKVPFSVIGGINKSNIKNIINAGVKHIAMISAITEADDVQKTVKEFIDMLILPSE